MIPLLYQAAQQVLIGDGKYIAVSRLLGHAAFIMGPEVLMFERQLADLCGAKYALDVANGTDALGISLMAHGVKRGDSILTPTVTFAATADLVAWLDTIQAAVQIENLVILADELDALDRVADLYSATLGNVVRAPRLLDGDRSAWAQYTVRLDGGRCDAVAATPKVVGNATVVYNPRSPNRQPTYRDWPVAGNDSPVSERLVVLSLPMHRLLARPRRAGLFRRFAPS
jgi:dTDP-4-amino-4,6-dideoxygalactose transaminase